jgi:hypothetical protein
VTGDVIAAKAVQAGSSDAGAEVANLINRSGLRDRDLDGLDEHDADAGHMWRSAKGDASPWVEFDLGEPQSLGAICIFNHNDPWFTDRGVRKADISVWTQEAGWKKIQDDLAIEQAQGTDDYDMPMFVKLDGVKAQKVRFDDMASFGDAEYVGLSEVEFFGMLGPQAVRPNPSDGAIGVDAGGLELKWIAGDGAKTHKVLFGVNPDDLKPLGVSDHPGAKMSQLSGDTKYFWRIDEVRADGSVSEGNVWSFATGGFAGWWRLDEKEGRTVADSSGNNHTGVIYGDPKWLPQAGRVGGAMQFDGVDDYVDTCWTPHLPKWTVAAWIKSPAAPTAPVASGPVHCEENFQFSWNHGDQQCQGAALVRVAGTWHSAGFGELKPNTWYHLAATYDGEDLKAYKDGVLITDKTDPSGDADSGPATLKFGRHATTTDAFFTGAVDDVCVYAYPLKEGNIKALFAGEEPSAIKARAVADPPRLLQASPAEAAEPSPQDGSQRAAMNRLVLTWKPGTGSTAHNVYFGTDPAGLQSLGKIADAKARLSRLADQTPYYWRVDEVQADGSVVKGPVWNFTTGSGLLGWWKLDEAQGQTVADSSLYGNGGAIVGGAKWQPSDGRFGGALEFNGTDSYVRIDNEPAFDLTDEVTVAAWVKVRAFDKKWQTIVAKGDNTWRLAREGDANSVQFTAGRVNDGRIVVGTVAINDGKWHHIVGVGDANSVSLYVDGVLDSVKKTPGRMNPDDEPVYIGENSEQPARGRFWNGWIDEVCVFNYAFNADDVKALYSSKESVARGAASSVPRLLQATLTGPALAAAGEPNATRIQPVSTQAPVADAAPQRNGRSPVAVIVILGIVGVVAGVSYFTRQKSQ